MRITKYLLTMLLLAFSALAFAQTKDPQLVEPDLPARGGAIPIPDNGYDGTLGSMACLTVPVAAVGNVENVSVQVAMEHTFIGDLTVKLVSPMGTIATVLSRPGTLEPDDAGTAPPFGASANLDIGSPLTYHSNAANDAELMGDGLVTDDVVCQDNGICDYFPNPGAAADSGDLSTIFDGEGASGNWELCVGDSAGADTGNLDSATVDVLVALPESQPVPTMSMVGLIALVLALGGLGLVLMRRRQQS